MDYGGCILFLWIFCMIISCVLYLFWAVWSINKVLTCLRWVWLRQLAIMAPMSFEYLFSSLLPQHSSSFIHIYLPPSPRNFTSSIYQPIYQYTRLQFHFFSPKFDAITNQNICSLREWRWKQHTRRRKHDINTDNDKFHGLVTCYYRRQPRNSDLRWQWAWWRLRFTAVITPKMMIHFQWLFSMVIAMSGWGGKESE